MTLNPGWLSNNSFKPARITLWSSANRMWISFTDFFCTLFCGEGKFHGEERATTGFRTYFALAAKVRDALFDTQQTETLRMLHVESSAVIADGKRQTLRLLLDINANSSGLRVTRTIVKRFLYDAVNARFVFVRQIIGDKIRRNGHVHDRPLCD